MPGRILVTGASGQLGHEVVENLAQQGYEVIAPTRQQMNFLVPGQVAEYALAVRADRVVNCAAYTQVDKAESEAGDAHTINCESAGRLAAAVAEYGGRLLHVSTDFVFDGASSEPYCEQDETNPLSVYGRSKRDGERAVMDALPGAVILRTAWVYGAHGNNFVKTMLRLAAERDHLRVVSDQVGTPTWTRDIAHAISELIRHEASGVFHFTAAGQTSWHGFATAILHEAGRLGFEVKAKTVEAIPTSEYPAPATRPAWSVLDTHKIQDSLSLSIPDWRDSLVSMLKELRTCAG
ncbi:MAG: dTDP-4-dehydrorhamnose reductase [Gammaproteobacteria bacterium]|nr:dTDP-4-dehydrorhamnose reductase [Gammaproteobacteria bacterium]